jgi:hypothetical protein
MRSWNEPFEMPGLWAPADETPAEPSPDATSSESPAPAEQDPGLGRPWPAYGTVHFEPEAWPTLRALGPMGNIFAAREDGVTFHGLTNDAGPASLLHTLVSENGKLGGTPRMLAGGAGVITHAGPSSRGADVSLGDVRSPGPGSGTAFSAHSGDEWRGSRSR